jgi:hypothetical protein
MNLGQMQTTLMRYGFDTTDPLTPWLNAAMHDVEASYDWPWMWEGPISLVVPAGSNTVTLPSDFFKVHSVKDLDHLCKLKFWNRHKFTRLIQDETDTGLMEIYTLIGTNQIQFWRVPITPTNIMMIYQAQTYDMVNPGDIPTTSSNPWPTMLHYPIVMRAASIALQAENEEDRAKTAQDEFDRALLRCMGKFSEDQLDEPDTVEDAQGYGADMPLRGIAGW